MKILKTALISIVAFAVFTYTLLAIPSHSSNEVAPTIIHLVAYQDSTDINEKIQHLDAGEYHIVVSNKTPESMDFAIQDISSSKCLYDFSFEAGESRISYIKIGPMGARIHNANSNGLATWQALNSL